MSAKSSKRARQPKKITTNRAIFAGVLVGTPDIDIMETERSAEHSVKTRGSPNIQISSRYSEVPSNMLRAIIDKLNELSEKMNRIERHLSEMDDRFQKAIGKRDCKEVV
ncbi:hypothetical protein C2G38_2150021 [Gigaspora rosea]|uniref:Uncharacterized protein n=1 Tax=Gigaspora rosea TaxID=44941 RepID=A0A397U5N9_9GLOM|nr:hypothetical protein C2G38_2150021 [Gigaspora rosea]